MGLLAAGAAFAEDSVVPSPVDCFETSLEMNFLYRADVAEACLSVPLRFCERASNPERCLGPATDDISARLDKTIDALPDSIPGPRWRQEQYVTDVFELFSSETTACEIDPTLHIAICTYMDKAIRFYSALLLLERAETALAGAERP
ncbi:MAG: hypothetical protein AAFX00_14530 [Pseudomonadota bacterium]